MSTAAASATATANADATADAADAANADAAADAAACATAHASAYATATAVADERNTSMSMRIDVSLHFPKGYIAHPYWPERERVITIQKESGINRARSLDKRDKALRAYLDTKAITLDDYRALTARAAREFYTAADVDDLPGAPPEEIVIPAHHLHGMMGQAADMAPAAVRLARPDQVRNLLTWASLGTGRTKPDGTWDRFVTVKAGTGQKLSNQRGLRSNQYLADVQARGSLMLGNPEHALKARQFIAWAGEEIGVGAARKLGWGRFVIEAWTPR